MKISTKKSMELKVKFFFVLLAIISSSVCETIENRQQTASDNERFLDIISGITAVVNQLIESVTIAFNDSAVEMTNLIQSEVLKIQNTLTNSIIAFNQYIEQSLVELDALIQEQIKPCLQNTQENIENVKENTKIAVEACQENGESKLSSIQLDIKAYEETNQRAVDAMSASIQSCVNETNFGDKIKCAVDASRNISSNVQIIRKNIANTTSLVLTEIREAVVETHECIANAIRDGHADVNQILVEARQCLEEATETSTNEGTTSDASGSTDQLAAKLFGDFL